MTTNGTNSFVQTKLFINNEVFTPPYTPIGSLSHVT